MILTNNDYLLYLMQFSFNNNSKGILIASQKKNITPINEKIRAEKVLLIGSDGEKLGLVEFSEALEKKRIFFRLGSSVTF